MMDSLSRSRLLLGQEGIDKLASSHVVILGLGGVGGYAAEALAREHDALIDQGKDF